jgi:hypothetical protein
MGAADVTAEYQRIKAEVAAKTGTLQAECSALQVRMRVCVCVCVCTCACQGRGRCQDGQAVCSAPQVRPF